MEKLFLGFLGVIFIYLNYRIIVSDIVEKKVPNTYLIKLILLLPFWYTYIFLSPNIDIFGISLITNVSVAIIIAFLLFAYNIWGAGDAKYLLVLYFFIPTTGIIGFIGCVSLTIIFYLFTNYIWFWTGKNIFSKQSGIYRNLLNSKKEKIRNLYSNIGAWSFGKKILHALILFLLIFVTIRITRIYLLLYIESQYNIDVGTSIKQLITSPYGVYVICLFGIILGVTFLIIRKGIRTIQNKVGKHTQTIIGIILLFGLSYFIYEKLLVSPEEIKKYLFIIFTVYMGLYLGFKLLWESYKLTFEAGEERYIPIEDLQEGMVIDKKELIQNMGLQKCLMQGKVTAKDKISAFGNPIDKKEARTIQKMYQKVELYHTKNKTPEYQGIKDIKIIQVFSLAPHIFIGFILLIIGVPEVVGQIISSVLSFL